MIQNNSDISSQGCHFLNNEIIKPNDSELYRLIQRTAEITNTTEKKINHIDVKAGTTKIGLLKYFLIGVTILKGIGELTAGRCYSMLERMNSGGR